MRKGDKIFLSVAIVFVFLYVIGGVLEDIGYGSVLTEPSIFFVGLVIWVGIPWGIYRGIVYYKAKKLKKIKG